MKIFIRKFSLSIISLLLTITIFGTVTYAWFTLARINILDNLTLRIYSGDNLEVSLDGENYYKSLPASVLKAAIGDQVKLKDVTTIDGIAFTNGPYGKGEPKANIDYISLTFWLRAISSTRKHVYLVNNVSNETKFGDVTEGTFVVSRGINWRADNTFINGPDLENDIITTGQRMMFYGSEAIRLSFVEEKDENNPLDYRENNELIKFIFDPSGDEERGYGKEYGAISYFKVKTNQEVNIPESFPNNLYNLTAFDESNPYVPLNNDSKIMELIKTIDKDPEGRVYYRGKVRVNIWLEGWDTDCFNSIFNDIIRVQLQFRSGRESS